MSADEARRRERQVVGHASRRRGGAEQRAVERLRFRLWVGGVLRVERVSQLLVRRQRLEASPVPHERAQQYTVQHLVERARPTERLEERDGFVDVTVLNQDRAELRDDSRV